MDDAQAPWSEHASKPRPRRALGVTLLGAACLLAGLVLLVPVIYYSYLNIDPPEMTPGDLYLGDGTGFAISAFFSVPAAGALVIGFLVMKRGRRVRG